MPKRFSDREVITTIDVVNSMFAECLKVVRERKSTDLAMYHIMKAKQALEILSVHWLDSRENAMGDVQDPSGGAEANAEFEIPVTVVFVVKVEAPDATTAVNLAQNMPL